MAFRDRYVQIKRSIGSKSSPLPAYNSSSEVILKPPVPTPRRMSGREVRGGRGDELKSLSKGLVLGCVNLVNRPETARTQNPREVRRSNRSNMFWTWKINFLALFYHGCSILKCMWEHCSLMSKFYTKIGVRKGIYRVKFGHQVIGLPYIFL